LIIARRACGESRGNGLGKFAAHTSELTAWLDFHSHIECLNKKGLGILGDIGTAMKQADPALTIKLEFSGL
jgi:hypothetical protein